MKIKPLISKNFLVAAIMDGEECPSEVFITQSEAAYKSSREGLAVLLERIADSGLAQLPSHLAHEVDKERKIYELIKGDLRLFYFKGKGNTIIVCTSGTIKKSKKVDKHQVNAAAKWRDAYLVAESNNTLEIIKP